MKKDVVVGLGEIGNPLLKTLSKNALVIGYDKDIKLMDQKKFEKYGDLQTSFLHIAIPVAKKFISNVITLQKKFQPDCIVVHSTIGPGYTTKLQSKMLTFSKFPKFQNFKNLI